MFLLPIFGAACRMTSWKPINAPDRVLSHCTFHRVYDCNDYYPHNSGEHKRDLTHDDPDPAKKMAKCMCCDGS